MTRSLPQIAAEARAARVVLARFRPLVQEYLAANPTAQTRFSLEAAGNKDFVRYLQDSDRDFRLSTIDNVLKYIGESELMT